MDLKEINDKNIFPRELFSIGELYSKKDIDFMVNKKIFKSTGVVNCLNTLLLFVTLDKSEKPDTQKYKDFFKNRKEFFWESQDPTRNKSYGSIDNKYIKLMLKGEISTILFARVSIGKKSKPNKFIYCGTLEAESYDTAANNLRPFGVKFRTLEIPKEIPREMKDLINWRPLEKSSLIEAEYLAIAQTVSKETNLEDSEGQGRIINQQLKKAIEIYAMNKAFDHYKSQGYATYDVSSKRKIGYDIKCERPGSTRYVEVKGTQNNGWCVFVTANEVDKAKKEPRDLFIVKNIKHRYDIEEFEYKCEGGEVKIISPWKPNSPKSSLKAIDYKFCPEK